MNKSSRFFLFSLAVIVGFGGIVGTALAGQDDLIPVCFHNRTIQIPTYLLARYQTGGAVPGACKVTGA